MQEDPDERLRRWRLVLGGAAEGAGMQLSGADRAIDGALQALYEAERTGGLGSSQPNIARWLGDIRNYFPSSVVQVLQRDALERLNLRQMLLQPELLEAVEPNVHLVADLLALKSVMPARTLDTARQVVRRVVDELMRKLANPTRQAIAGSLNRAARSQRPRHSEIDWQRTIRANLSYARYHSSISANGTWCGSIVKYEHRTIGPPGPSPRIGATRFR